MYDFSVIIPTHNRCSFLQKAIDSVLAQTVQAEIIVVDDASTDNTPEIMCELTAKYGNVVYLRNDRSLFAHRSRQRGYLKATGNYIVFMDDDDYYIDNTFFSKAKSILDAHAEVCSVLGATVNFCNGEYGPPMDLCGSGIIPNRQYFNNFSSQYPKPQSSLTAVFRKKALDAAGLATSNMVNDTCIYLYGILNGDVYLLNKPVAAYYLHANNISKRSLPIGFVFGTLNEKIRIYKLAQKARKIDNKQEWLSRHLGISILYFLQTSKGNIIHVAAIALWVLLYGHGFQLFLCKKFLKKLFCRNKAV